MKFAKSSIPAVILFVFCVCLFGIGVYARVKHIGNRERPVHPTQNSEQAKTEQISSSEEEFPKQYSPKNPVPKITSEAYVVEDLKTGTRLAESNADKMLPPASLTKIMTALLALERYDLAESVVVPPSCTKLSGSKVGVAEYEVFTLEDLLYGTLVRSGADAACAIASIDGEKVFVKAMNEKAKVLGMKNTVFENEIGFDVEAITPSPKEIPQKEDLRDEGNAVLGESTPAGVFSKEQKSSVNDIVILSKEALKYRTFQKIVGTQRKVITSLNSGNSYVLENTNDLLKIPGTVGIKTGLTDQAGQCLSYLYENKDEQILIVVLGSQDRFGDTQKLLTWAREEVTR